MSTSDTTSNDAITISRTPRIAKRGWYRTRPGSVPEWPKGAACKVAAKATLVRIQPGPPTHLRPALVRRASRVSAAASSGRYWCMATPRRRALLSLAAGLLATFLATSCASTGQRYIKNSSDGLYFKIPDDWAVYEEDAILDFQADQLAPEELESVRDRTWQVFFDAAPKPSLRHLEEFATSHPNGQAQVLELAPQQRDTVSLEVLRNLVFPIDEILQIDPSLVEVVEAKEISSDGNRGVQFVFNIETDAVDQLILGLEPEPGRERTFATVNQTAVLDSEGRTLY